jgi:hypothetical protein
VRHEGGYGILAFSLPSFMNGACERQDARDKCIGLFSVEPISKSFGDEETTSPDRDGP